MYKTIAMTFAFVAQIGLFSAVANAETVRQDSFDLDGYTYVYTSKVDAKGQTITGVRYPDATPFTLTVKGSRVEGTSAGQPVNFLVADAKGAAKDAEIFVAAKSAN